MKARITTLEGVCVVGILLILASCAPKAPDAIIPTSERQAAPKVSIIGSDRQLINLVAYQGEVVLVDFWATWCQPCIAQGATLAKLQQQFGERRLRIVGLSEDEDGWKSVTPFVAAHSINYGIGLSSQVIDSQFGGVPSLPKLVIVDKRGRIAGIHLGVTSGSSIADEIEQLSRERS